MNININDIEDDDLRKKVLKYFKTFKKGKLEDDDLADDSDDKEEKNSDDNDNSDKEEKNSDDNDNSDKEELDVDDVDIDDEDLLDYLNDNPKDKKKMIKALKDSDLSDDDKDKALKMLEESEINESLLLEKNGYGKAFLVGAFLTPVGGLAGMGGLAIVRSSIKASVKKTEKQMKENIEKETDPEKKKKLEQDLNTYQLANRNSDGEILCSKSAKEKNIKRLRNYGKLPKDFSVEDLTFLKKDAKKYDKENKKEDVEKDEDGNILKQEEITDKDGKKKKVTTHTGPRGGKFYWPDGSPKDAEHKVYIGKNGKVKECVDLKDYLYESFK